MHLRIRVPARVGEDCKSIVEVGDAFQCGDGARLVTVSAVSDTAPSDFYTGLVADLYAPLKSASFPPDRYVELIAKYGQPALELGCGDGDLLLDLHRAGLDVDGIDSSADMIARLRRRAAELGITANAWVTTMEELTTTRGYRTIFLAGPTFNLLPSDDHMARSLERIRMSLAPDGTAVIPLFKPSPAEPGPPRRQETSNGWIACGVGAAHRDEAARIQSVTLRYERSQDGELETLDRDSLLHWVDTATFAKLVEQAGLTADIPTADIGAEPVDWILRPLGRNGRRPPTPYHQPGQWAEQTVTEHGSSSR